MKSNVYMMGLTLVFGLFSGCGMEPSGGGRSSSAQPAGNDQLSSATSDKKDEADATRPTSESEDAMPAGVAQLPASLTSINTDEVAACHEQGSVFDRRTMQCSTTMKLASSYTCDAAGITGVFKLTGFQIVEALTAADQDGFVLDQCGESDSGKVTAYFVRPDEDGSYSIREIETKVTSE